MAEGAALLVDEVLPPVCYRPWVLTFEGPMAVRLGYDSDLLRRVSRSFAHRVSQHVRRAVKRHHGLPSMANLHAGVLSVVQRLRADGDPGSHHPWDVDRRHAPDEDWA